MRLIIEGCNDASFNMALDEAISEAVRRGLSPPTLRFYQWNRPSVTIGCFQKASDIDIYYCKKMGYPVVRRPTGGRAILHKDELTYSLSAGFDTDIFKGSLREDYAIISNVLLNSLRLCGIEARVDYSKRRQPSRDPVCFRSISYGEIMIEDRKVIGNAQKRFDNGFIQQGSIPMSIDKEEVKAVFNIDYGEDPSWVATIREFAPWITINELIGAIKRSFEDILGVKLISDNPTHFEIKLEKKLEVEKYSTDGWNLRR